MSWFDTRRENTVYVVREVEVSTYGSYTNMDETSQLFERLEDAKEYAEWCADAFEEAHSKSLFGEEKVVRLADEPMLKVLFSRSFDRHGGLCEDRIIISERYI